MVQTRSMVRSQNVNKKQPTIDLELVKSQIDIDKRPPIDPAYLLIGNSPTAKDEPMVYRGFWTAGQAYRERVDFFHKQRQKFCRPGENKELLKSFWLNDSDVHFNFPTAEMDLNTLVALLESQVCATNPIWEQFNKACNQFSPLNFSILEQSQVTDMVKKGVYKFTNSGPFGIKVDYDLTKLLPFKYWTLLTTKLLRMIIQKYLAMIEVARGSENKAELSKKLFRVLIVSKRYISNPYVSGFGNMTFFYTVVNKAFEFIQNEGVEFSLLALAVFEPHIVCDEVYPILSKSNPELRNSSLLKIDSDDKVYGPLKTKYQKYCTL